MCIIYIKYIEWSIFNKENSTLPQSYLKNDNDMSVLVWKDFQDMLLTFENQAWSGAWETKKVSPTFAWANWFESFQALGTKMRTLSWGVGNGCLRSPSLSEFTRLSTRAEKAAWDNTEILQRGSVSTLKPP